MQWTRVIGGGVFLVAAAVPAQGQTQPPPRININEGIELIGTSVPRDIQRGLEALGAAGSPAAIGPVSDRVRRGLPPELLEMAVDTLAVIGNAAAGPILFELTSHRRREIRFRAVAAILACKPPGAAQALLGALSDDAEDVRNAAAEGLGQLGDVSAIDKLFLALDRGVLPAAEAIGRLGRPEHAERLLGYLGRIPLDGLAAGLTSIVTRPDIPERTKLQVVARLLELATPEIKVLLQGLLASLPAARRGRRDAVREAVEGAILRIVD